MCSGPVMKVSCTSAVVRTAPIGITPDVRPLAQVIRSGCTPKYCEAKGAPSRPKPVMTSSKLKRMPCFFVIARSRSR